MAHPPTYDRIPAELKEELRKEFNGQCAYCKAQLGPSPSWSFDRFIPRSRSPELASDPSNYFPACALCNLLKADKYPTTESGEPLLINPRTDSFNDHISLEKDGIAVGLTPKGEATIRLFNLNRPQLVDIRRAEQQAADYFRELDLNLPESLKVFKDSIAIVRSLNQSIAQPDGRLANIGSAEARYLRNMLFGNIIGAMEAYLSDTLIGLVLANTASLRQFVETFLDFKKEKFELREVFARYDTIREHASKSLRDIIYHDMPKVAGIYKDACGIEVTDFGDIMKSILIRHDVVHRNGKTKDGVAHSIRPEEIEALCVSVEELVNKVDVHVQKVIAARTFQ